MHVSILGFIFFFNQTCLNERPLPNYTCFKIHDPVVHHGTDTQKYCCSLVKRQINYNKEKINILNTEAHNKLERILIKLYRQNVSLLFNQRCLNERLRPKYKHTHIYVMCVCVCVCVFIFCFGCVLWHTNPCGLFDSKSCLYIYITYLTKG